jgi:hypothetical protein
MFGSVRGKVEPLGEGYVRSSEAHFALVLSDAEFDEVIATIARYEAMRQPSYSLNRRNCVHFIAEIAAAAGMEATVPGNLTRRPGAFLASLIRTNRAWLAQRPGARILREPRAEEPERRRRRAQRD